MLKVHKNTPLFLVYGSLYHSQTVVATLNKKILPKVGKICHNSQQETNINRAAAQNLIKQEGMLAYEMSYYRRRLPRNC